MDITVIKRDGSKEPYQEEKLKKVVKTAGCVDGECNIVANKVTGWLEDSEKKEITSLEIRDAVIEEMKKTNENAANMFEWYQKTKDKFKTRPQN